MSQERDDIVAVNNVAVICADTTGLENEVDNCSSSEWSSSGAPCDDKVGVVQDTSSHTTLHTTARLKKKKSKSRHHHEKKSKKHHYKHHRRKRKQKTKEQLPADGDVSFSDEKINAPIAGDVDGPAEAPDQRVVVVLDRQISNSSWSNASDENTDSLQTGDGCQMIADADQSMMDLPVRLDQTSDEPKYCPLESCEGGNYAVFGGNDISVPLFDNSAHSTSIAAAECSIEDAPGVLARDVPTVESNAGQNALSVITSSDITLDKLPTDPSMKCKYNIQASSTNSNRNTAQHKASKTTTKSSSPKRPEASDIHPGKDPGTSSTGRKRNRSRDISRGSSSSGKSRSRSRSRSRSTSRNRSGRSSKRNRDSISDRKYSTHTDRTVSKHKSRKRSHSTSRRKPVHRKRSRSRSHSKSRTNVYRRRSRSRSNAKSRTNVYRKRSRSRSHSRSRSNVYRKRGYSRSRSRSRSKSKHVGRHSGYSHRRSRSRSSSRRSRRRSHRGSRRSRTRSQSPSKHSRVGSSLKRSSHPRDSSTSSSEDGSPQRTAGKSQPDSSSKSAVHPSKPDRSDRDDGDNSKASKFIGAKRIEIKLSSSSHGDSKPAKPVDRQQQSSLIGEWTVVEKSDTDKPELAKLTDFCKTLSKKEGVESPVPDACDTETSSSGYTSRAVHHPFIVTPAPMMPPMNMGRSHPGVSNHPTFASIRNAITASVTDVFPVSSGIQHRDSVEPTAKDDGVGDSAKVFNTSKVNVDISAVLARRLKAQQVLLANPMDPAAAAIVKRCDTDVQQWSQTNLKPGQFSGATSTVALQKYQLEQGYQAWARKDMFHTLPPIRGGVGMRLLEKMGWTLGQPLGRRGEGYTQPISLDVKMDRKGLSAAGDAKAGGKNQTATSIQGKHPVSVLSELCSKQHRGQPSYEVVMDDGPQHRKKFLYRVIIQGNAYQTQFPSANKKQAKLEGALAALKGLGQM